VRYRRAFLLPLRCQSMNDRDVNSRPRDIPAAKVIITNFLVELTDINISLGRQ
jgi:hypothetical protein